MYISLDWLKDYVDIPKNITPKDLGLKLTMHTVEIDEVINQIDKFNNVVIGKVLSVEKHPGADRLNLAKVEVGGKEILDIVCGAPNLEKGQLVPVALVGAVLPGDFKIEEREVRGEKSFGMICAEDELGLGENHEGIMVLDRKAKIGQNFGEYLKLDDILFDVDNKSITNRPDLWGHLGMAREVSAFLNLKKTKKFQNIINNTLENNKELPALNVKIEDKEKCPRYMSVAISGIEIKDSVSKIKNRLTAVGMKSINNIVDATNYVMLELGQPLHAFDKSKVDEIVVRKAKKDEVLITLDNEEKKLDSEMLIIADNKKPLAVAGIIGGQDSGINKETTEIILEVANFEPVSIRKTSSKLGIRTEASMRFEKSLDANLCESALVRFFEIIKETCPDAKISSQIIDESNFQINQGPISIGMDWLNKRVGEEFSTEQVKETLEKLGFVVEGEKPNFNVTIPTWRATKDIAIKEDLLEEVARIYGYDNLIPKMPLVSINVPDQNNERVLERKIKEILAFGARMNEVSNYSFVGDEKIKKAKLNTDDYIRLANPISNVHTMLRQNLFINMIDNVKTNQAKYDDIELFEIGNVFLSLSGRINKDNSKKENLPFQEKHLCLVQSGGGDVYTEIKSKLEYLIANFFLKARYETTEHIPDWANKASFAKIVISGEEVGFVSRLNKDILSSMGVKKEVAILEISFEKMVKLISSTNNIYKKGSKFPSISRDLAFVIPAKVLYNDIKDNIENFNELISEVELFDVYQGKNLEKGKRSLAFHINYSSNLRTLKSDEVDVIQEKLIAELKNKFDADIRDF